VVHLGAVGQLLMDEDQQPLQQYTPVRPTGVAKGVDEAFCAIGSSRQTRQGPQRVGHEDQTPMFPHGFGTPHPIIVEAQVPLTVLTREL
jgi:hypothetical protein